MNYSKQRNTHMIENNEHQLAPEELWIDFSVGWPDGEPVFEDMKETPFGPLRTGVRYIRADVLNNTKGEG